MCLYTTQKEPKMAEKDITCYKVLKIYNPEWEGESGRKGKKTVLQSYYNPKFKWNVDKHYRSRLVIEPRHLTNNYSVNKAFHAYQTLESAKSFCKSSLKHPGVIVRCIIPKGAKYCAGQHGNEDGYASNRMIMKEIIDFKELYPDFDSDRYPYKQGQLLYVSDSSYPNDGEIMLLRNITPLDSKTVRLQVGLTFYLETDIDGRPLLATAKIQVYNDKETK